MFLRYPGGLTKALTFSYDDGVEQDMRLVKLLDDHGMKGTFNLNSGLFSPQGTTFAPGTIHRRMTLAQSKALFTGNHEVAVHCDPCLPAGTFPGADGLRDHQGSGKPGA